MRHENQVSVSYPFGLCVIVKVLRPLQVGAVKTADGDGEGKAGEVKRREGVVADGEAGPCHFGCSCFRSVCAPILSRSVAGFS